MCFGGGGGNKEIDEEQVKQEEEATEAKEIAKEETAEKKEEVVEAKKQEAIAPVVTEKQVERQSETQKGAKSFIDQAAEEPTVGTSKMAPKTLTKNQMSEGAKKRAKRSAGKGRRSLITAQTSQGYFSRFL